MVILTIVSIEKLPDFWPLALPYIEKSLRFAMGENTVDDLYESCLSGQSTLWVGMEKEEVIAAGMCHFVEYPQFKVCESAFGGVEEGLGITPQIVHLLTTWAKFNGCTRLRTVGRRGFEKTLKNEGFSLESVTMGKWI